MSTVTHYQMTLEEHLQQRGSYVDPDRYKPGHRDYQPEMLCHTGDGHARGARNKAAVTCPACLQALRRRKAQRTKIPALLIGAFLALGASGCTRAPRDLVTVAQYPDGSFSVDVYDAEGELATTLHLPSDARMADAFPASKGDPQ